jgi:ABC-type Zn uptake system ZnuABC Zn-binding protein ZnuA
MALSKKKLARISEIVGHEDECIYLDPNGVVDQVEAMAKRLGVPAKDLAEYYKQKINKVVYKVKAQLDSIT